MYHSRGFFCFLHSVGAWQKLKPEDVRYLQIGICNSEAHRVLGFCRELRVKNDGSNFSRASL